ncbi:MAG: type III-B CRISPR module RAMP protein Cmr4 [Acidobacteriota bacterium]
MRTRLVLVHALTPLHAGTGQAAGAIDLPIARERPTHIPIVPGSSIKGALRAREEDENWRKVIYGPETELASEHGGAVQFSDVHTVLLPVRSLAGTFAWVTSRYLLSRFARDAQEADLALKPAPAAARMDACVLVQGSVLKVPLDQTQRVILEDLDLKPAPDASPEAATLAAYAETLGQALFPDPPEATAEQKAANAAAQKDLSARLCLVHDDTMSYLLEAATEVSARIRLDPKKKTVARGALWTEEALPTETVLAGLAVASAVERDNKKYMPADLFAQIGKAAKGLVQLGGKATVGRGNCRVLIVPAAAGGTE